MAEIVRMPRMSDTMEEGVIVEWHKKVGDKVGIGDLMAEIETDKATMDFESPYEGTILYLGAKKDEAVPIEGVLAIVGEEDEDYESLLEEEKKKEKEEKKEEKPKEEKEVKEQEEEKPEEEEPAEKTKTEETPKEETKGTSKSEDGRIKASPLAKKMAKEKGIDLTSVRGTGDEGRIIKRDIEGYEETKPAAKITAPVGEESYEEIKLSQMRKTIAKRLANSKFSAPHYYLTMKINMNRAIEARKSINEVAPEKISFNDIIIKAVAASLRQHPKVNASWQEDSIRINHHIHIGMAVAVEEGLVVPVIKFADNKTLSQISREAKDFASRAKEGKLKLEEMQGNTFTISNLGMFGIEEFTAIINPPDACILAVGAIKQIPAVENGELKETNVMKVTMSCDHRAVDGATGAKFLQTFKQMLEEPVRIMV